MRFDRKFAVVGMLLVLGTAARADSLWERRTPYTGYLFQDYRARRTGDLLTIVVNEATEFEGQEKREMNKETNTGFKLNLAGKSSAGNNLSRKVSGDLDAGTSSQRKFDGKANSTIDRKFTDRMTVVVLDVQPNGNLVVEGIRQRVVGREVRTLRVSGVVRPADIGPANTVQSQFVANFQIVYVGRGPDTNFTNQGWGGRILNVLWPY